MNRREFLIRSAIGVGVAAFTPTVVLNAVAKPVPSLSDSLMPVPFHVPNWYYWLAEWVALHERLAVAGENPVFSLPTRSLIAVHGRNNARRVMIDSPGDWEYALRPNLVEQANWPKHKHVSYTDDMDQRVCRTLGHRINTTRNVLYVRSLRLNGNVLFTTPKAAEMLQRITYPSGESAVKTSGNVMHFGGLLIIPALRPKPDFVGSEIGWVIARAQAQEIVMHAGRPCIMIPAYMAKNMTIEHWFMAGVATGGLP